MYSSCLLAAAFCLLTSDFWLPTPLRDKFKPEAALLICRQSEWIEVRRLENRGEGGRGVFARKDIPAGTLLERVPVILIPKSEIFGIAPVNRRSLLLALYAFSWEPIANDTVALALGYGSIYNHSFDPNARYTPVAPDVLEFHAIKPIAAGTEIFVNYHGRDVPGE
jgi:SET domain-containing protein